MTPPEAERPNVSVVVPTYNSSEYLAEGLASIDAQTYRDLEVVISDDGSSDATLDIARSWAAATDLPVRVVSTPQNLGPAGNFRNCVREARAPFVKFLIPDDLLHPDAIQCLLRPLLEDDTVVLSTSRRQLVDAERKPLPDVHSSRHPYAHGDLIVNGIDMGDQMLSNLANYVGEPSSVLIRRDAVEPDDAFRFAGHEFRVLADVSMWLSLCERGSVSYQAARLTSFRRHRNQDQRSVRLVLRGNREWLRLAWAARQRGFLADRVAFRQSLFDARVRAFGRLARRASAGLSKQS